MMKRIGKEKQFSAKMKLEDAIEMRDQFCTKTIAEYHFQR